MTVQDYPEFAPGQTLTAPELNLMIGHLRDRDTLMGRLIGFGVNCGLTGTTTTRTVTIAPGLAIDQDGTPLLLEAAHTLNVPEGVANTVYSFVGDSDGYSVVLRAASRRSEPPACDDACGGHSVTLTDTVELDLVRGKIKEERFTFLSHPILDASFARVNKSGSAVTGFAPLRKLLVRALLNRGSGRERVDHVLIDQALIERLNNIDVTKGDFPASHLYKVGWINALLLATVQLLRCRALTSIPCDREVEHPGVVLGHIVRDGEGWIFDCRKRHDWEPPVGITTALLGGTCEEPCQLYRGAVESLIETYAPPKPPADPTEPPDVSIPNCSKSEDVKQRVMREVTGWPCEVITAKSDDRRTVGELAAVAGWLDTSQRSETIDVDKLIAEVQVDRDDLVINPAAGGVIALAPTLGHDAEISKGVIVEELKARNQPAKVRIVDQDQVDHVEGYNFALDARPGDEVVLSVDESGRVVSMGVVPLGYTVKQSVTAIPAALEAAEAAGQSVSEMAAVKTQLDDQLLEVSGGISRVDDELGSLSEEFVAFRGGAYDSQGYGTRLALLEKDMGNMDKVGERLAHLEGAGVGRKASEPGLSAGVSQGLSEFTESMVAALNTVPESTNPNFPRYRGAVERAHAEFEVAVAGDDPKVRNQATVKLLETMRTAVKAAGADASTARELDAQVRMLRNVLQ